MTIHAFTEYLKYKWKAKSRHGIHSPFVYAFVEDVVQNRKRIDIPDHAELPGLTHEYNELVVRMLQYFRYKNVLILHAERNDNIANFDALLFPGKEPLLWFSLAAKSFGVLKNDTVVVVNNIHATAAHTYEWNRICEHPNALMNIDLYGVGLIFFREEFKEKQHFVLNC